VGTAIISGVLGLLGGGVASLLAPWSKWGVEKRKIDRQYRRDLIRQWRSGIANLTTSYNAIGNLWYESLRAHLTDDEIRAVEGGYSPRTTVVEPDASERGRKPGIDVLARAVARIERRWKLEL
jgi:hypothetical protein